MTTNPGDLHHRRFTLARETGYQQEIDAQVLVVGGSLTGLTFALACAKRGVDCCLLEQIEGRHRGGGGLGIDRALLKRVLGLDDYTEDQIAGFPVTTWFRQAVTWQSLYDWLRERVLRNGSVNLLENTTIAEVAQSDTAAIAITRNGRRIHASVIVGADGYRSVVRAAVDPEQTSALYAGYLLWRGLVSEADLPTDTAWPSSNDEAAFVTETGYRLVAYPLAGQNHSLQAGKRLISFAWYDSTRDGLLHESGCLSGTNEILRSLPAEEVPRVVRTELRELAQRIWPDPWRAVIVYALDHGKVFATPIVEYFPRHLCRGRLAIIGDAAHVVSPVMGKGYSAGLLDAEILAERLQWALVNPEPDFPILLKRYEEARLPAVQDLVAASMTWSREFVSVKKGEIKRKRFE